MTTTTNSNSSSTPTLPTPEEFSTEDYRDLNLTHRYRNLNMLLDDLCPMIARGEVASLPSAHPGLYNRVRSATEDWSFAELHSCASKRKRQCPVSLKELRDQLGKPDYTALRYVLLRLALSRATMSAAKQVLQKADMMFRSAGVVTDFATPPGQTEGSPETREVTWYTPQQMTEFFGAESSQLSRGSRFFRTVKGHYIVRRELTDEEKVEHGKLSFLYRPVSLEEKIRDLHDNFGKTEDELVDMTPLSRIEIDMILMEDEENVKVFNPFDVSNHDGFVNYDAIVDSCVPDSTSEFDQTSPQTASEPVSENADEVSEPVAVSTEASRFATILEYLQGSGGNLDVKTVRSMFNIENSEDLLDLFQSVDQDLLFSVI